MRVGTCRRVKGKKGIMLCMTTKGPRFKSTAQARSYRSR
jgi:hypothetical protein